MQILRDNPDTLQGAIATATKEQNLRARANLSSHYHSHSLSSDRNEEPMEIDHYRPLRCFKCKKTGHSSKTCRNVPILNDAKRKTQISYAGTVAKKVTYCDYVNKIVMDGLKDLGQVKNSDGHSRKTR